ncbi:hypothetical protein BU23DRAFT_602884 [Bimuria novae-zelandiae CBS 107.79]|uniref:Uncharacterized protein n=1 Tax=Bimuria novae-zelandiae CBS 107.79 TaxID=1447943 RepID=A0A6A5V2D5_9PLEO|nr:hypothetical protein BU23DRAFT_602884 [Bimuria novae-zelandiae CBS 107.79]
MVSTKSLLFTALSASSAVSAWRAGAFHLSNSCNTTLTPDSGWRSGDPSVTSGCQGFVTTGSGINRMMVENWDDNCHFDIYDVIDTSCEFTDVLFSISKDQGDQEGDFLCTNALGFPNGFNFKYVCE